MPQELRLIGQRVRVPWLDREGTVEEIHGALALVVCCSDNRAAWVRIDALVPVEPVLQRAKVTP